MKLDQTKESTPPSFRSLLKLESKRSVIYSLSAFLPKLGSFLVVPLLWQKLTPSDFGIIAVTDIIGAILGTIFGLSLDSNITRFYYEWPEQERKKRVGAIWLTSWGSAVILGCVSLFFMSSFSYLLFPQVTFYPFVFLGLINTILSSFMFVPFATMRIKQLPSLYSTFSIASSVLQMCLSVYFVLILDKHVIGYFVANIMSNAIIAIVAGAIMLKFAVPCIRGGGLRKSIQYSLPLIPAGLIAGFCQSVDRFILQQYASLETLGIYAISLKFAGLPQLLHSALKLSYIPFMVESLSKNQVTGIRNITKMSLFYVLPLIMMGLIISAYAKDFILFTNSPAYLPVIQWVPWLVWATMLQTVNIYFNPGLFLSNRSDLMWIPEAIKMACIILSGLLLIPAYQMEGVVISRYFTAISFFLVYFIMSEKLFPVPVNWTKVFLLVAIMIFGTTVMSIVEFNSLVVSVVSKALFIVILGLICLIIILDSPSFRAEIGNLKSKIAKV